MLDTRPILSETNKQTNILPSEFAVHYILFLSFELIKIKKRKRVRISGSTVVWILGSFRVRGRGGMGWGDGARESRRHSREIMAISAEDSVRNKKNRGCFVLLDGLFRG